MRPKVSIVLPVYNGERYICESIDSILTQTFSDWELVCVNDCSTDNTPKILEAYVRKDSRIRVIHNKENQKLPRSLNIGFAESKGDFFTWTSDDNLYLPEALRSMYDFLNQNINCPMVVTDMENIDEDGKLIGQGPPYDNQKLYTENCVGACFLYRRSVREKVGEYDASRFLVEDYDYWLRVRKQCGEIKRISRVLYLYRRHSSSLTAMRQRDVQMQRAKLLVSYFADIMREFSDGKAKITKIFYDAAAVVGDLRSLQSSFLEYVPELSGDIALYGERLKGSAIVFGAGITGKMTYEMIRGHVVAFADNDISKVGQKIDGVEIMLFNDAIRKYPDVTVVIAVRTEWIYQIVFQLIKMGIHKYAVYQSMLVDNVLSN